MVMYDFEMFTDEGNKACTDAIERIKALINGDKFVSENELKSFVRDQVEQVASVYPEVHDTEPEYYFEARTNKALEAKGYAYRVSRYDF